MVRLRSWRLSRGVCSLMISCNPCIEEMPLENLCTFAGSSSSCWQLLILIEGYWREEILNHLSLEPSQTIWSRFLASFPGHGEENHAGLRVARNSPGLRWCCQWGGCSVCWMEFPCLPCAGLGGLKIGKIEKGPLGSETKHLLVINIFETVSWLILVFVNVCFFF